MQESPVINKIQSLALKTMPKGSQVFLYGSRARGDYNADSDWDLLILVDKENISNSDHDKYAYPFTYLGWEMGIPISPILYSKKQWASYNFTPFHKNVEQDQICLYES